MAVSSTAWANYSVGGRALQAWLALLRARPLQVASCAGGRWLASISCLMRRLWYVIDILMSTGRLAASVKSRAADTLENNAGTAGPRLEALQPWV